MIKRQRLTFSDVWIKAYDIYTECKSIDDMNHFLMEQVKIDNISITDKYYIAKSIINVKRDIGV